MTTAASDKATVPSEIRDELLTSFAAKASPRTVSVSFQAVPATGDTQEPPVIQWLEATAKALNRLP